MCGITGIFAFNLIGKFNKIHVTQATQALSKRGPDFQDIFLDEWIALGHRRLSIIDTSAVSNQPLWDESRRYCIVFNGEIFNFRELRHELRNDGTTFFSQGDTEVLLKLYMKHGAECLEKLNGFFAFCILDRQEQELFIARDRFGIKPLYYCFDEDKFIFASEMKSIIQYGIDKKLDINSLFTYLQLNYIPAPATIFHSVKKLLPGHYAKVRRQKLDIRQWYSIPFEDERSSVFNYDQAKTRLVELLEAAVKRRLVADVPLGAFLSGGIDSSIVTGLAAKYKSDLHTFSIGFRDEKFYDETTYANLVAKHFNTRHTVFELSNDDLYAHLDDVLNYIDEPFADSSALAVYILSKETRRHATVALSGDGADEMFAGYNKHAAFYRIINPGWKERVVAALEPLWEVMPQSRGSFFSDKARQLNRFAKGFRLTSKERYWQWAGFANEKSVLHLLSEDVRRAINEDYYLRKTELLKNIPVKESLNNILYTDLLLVLPNDMLTKVDLMSMANGLEVRVPFLDVNVVNFVSTLPDAYKINPNIRKRILQDSFRGFLPKELYNRPKKGFEVPLLKWFRKELRSKINDDLLHSEFIKAQGVFNEAEISSLKQTLFSSNPGDIHARIWGLIVFQHWWKRFSPAI